jgi:uncharacterized hydrophobic protein (TIGR00341 family)
VAKRLIVVSLPHGARLAELPNPGAVVSVADDAEVDGRRTVSLLLEGKQVEEALDALEERWHGREGFHAVVVGVEASLPRPEKEPEPPLSTLAGPEKPAAKDDRISRDELYADVTDGLGVSPMFVLLIAMATVVAAVGLVRDDVAVIVGAMVVAPLLRPNVAMALGAALGDLDLIGRASRAVLVGGSVAFAVAWAVGAVLAVDPVTPELARRSVLGAGDFALALAAGAAGSLAFTRGLAGAVIGVMVSVALLPPVVASGLLAGTGEWRGALGAIELALANTICINLAGIASFLATGVRPRAFYEAEKARRLARVALVVWSILLAALAFVVWLSTGEASDLLGR